MKKLNLLYLLFILLVSSCTNEAPKDKPNFKIKQIKSSTKDVSQFELNAGTENQLLQINREMDSILNKIYAEYSQNKTFIKNLQKSQQLWLKFHESEMLAKFPEDDMTREGSAFNLCWYSHKIQLKRQRIENLKVWLLGEQEGEICSGSVKIKGNLGSRPILGEE
jgi:uncharacterized protein YecT (DUF1311 family)